MPFRIPSAIPPTRLYRMSVLTEIQFLLTLNFTLFHLSSFMDCCCCCCCCNRNQTHYPCGLPGMGAISPAPFMDLLKPSNLYPYFTSILKIINPNAFIRSSQRSQIQKASPCMIPFRFHETSKMNKPIKVKKSVLVIPVGWTANGYMISFLR